MSQEEKDLEKEQPVTEAQSVETEEASTEKTAKQERRRREQKKRADKQSDNTEMIQELGQKLVEANDKYVRMYSEYENYRKRTNLEKADLILNGGKDVVKAVLPVVDDIERALQAMGDEENAKEGVQLIYNKLMNILSQKGLKPIEAKGCKFDENLHEAVTQFPAADESQKGMVVDVVEKGYFLNDKVLRYAKVVVAV